MLSHPGNRCSQPFRLILTLIIFVALAISAGTTYGAVIYVDASAGGLNNGTSWTHAYTDLQLALAAATSTDEIWVAAGTYLPHASDRGVSFDLPDGVEVYGGFDGTEVSRSDRDWVSNVTTLSGDIGTPADSLDNSIHVVTATHVGPTTVCPPGIGPLEGACFLTPAMSSSPTSWLRTTPPRRAAGGCICNWGPRS